MIFELQTHKVDCPGSTLVVLVKSNLLSFDRGNVLNGTKMSETLNLTVQMACFFKFFNWQELFLKPQAVLTVLLKHKFKKKKALTFYSLS